VAETLWRIVLVVAVTNVGVAASDEAECVAAQAPTLPIATRATTTPTMVGRLLKASALRRTSVPFVEGGRFLASTQIRTSDWEGYARNL